MQEIRFCWKTFVKMIDDMSCHNPEVQFSKLEKVILECYFYGMNEQDILRVLEANRLELNYYYSSGFFRWCFRPDVMQKLSKLIGEPVNKGNFSLKFRQRYEEDRRQI